MKYYYEFTLDKADHFLAKRKPNKQVMQVLSELLPHHTELICTRNAFSDFQDVMYALGFVVINTTEFKIGSDGKKLGLPPTKHNA